MLERKHESGNMEEIIEMLDLAAVMDRNIEDLSGGELQRFAIAMVCVQNADVWVPLPRPYLLLVSACHPSPEPVRMESTWPSRAYSLGLCTKPGDRYCMEMRRPPNLLSITSTIP